MPRLIYVKSPAPDREARLAEMISRIEADGDVSYQRFSDRAELQSLVQNDLAVLLSERFEMAHAGTGQAQEALASALPVPTTPLVGREREAASEPVGSAELRRWGAFRRPGPGSAGRHGGSGRRRRAGAENFRRPAGAAAGLPPKRL